MSSSTSRLCAEEQSSKGARSHGILSSLVREDSSEEVVVLEQK